MNQQQRKYALARVAEIKNYKIKKLQEDCETKAVYLSEKERFQAFQKGQFRIKKDISKISNYTDVVSVIAFDAEKERSFDDQKFKRESIKIEKEANKVSDEIMLGDAQEAMRLLEKFES